jgi:uncharacterized membrane protein
VLPLVHPDIVHFAVAFIVVGASLEAYAYLRSPESLLRWAAPLLVVGTVSLIAVIFTGYLAANSIEVDPAAMETLKSHEKNGWILLALVVLAQFWKAWNGGRIEGAQRKLYAAWLLLIVACALYGALLGGELVYQWGVGVGEG